MWNHVYLISYDLLKPEKSEDYKKIISYIVTFDHKKPLLSQWLIKTQKSLKEVTDKLLTLIDQNDRLLVVDVTNAERGWWLNRDIRTRWRQ